MGRRLELHNLLLEILPKVYFQAPPNNKMEYPCILYTRDDADTKFAGNSPYSYTQRYQVTLIETNPDSPTLDKLRSLPMCVYDRHYKANNLNHDTFVLYY